MVEHLVFMARRDGVSLEHRLRAAGAGDENASTEWDRTTFYGFGPNQSLPVLVSLFADVLDDPLASIDETDFEHERQIVRNELRLRTENGTPGQAVGFLATAVFPHDHPYAHPVGGTEESLDRLTLADARAFVAAHYRAASCALAISSPMPVSVQMDTWAQALNGHAWAVANELPDPGPLIRHDVPEAAPANAPIVQDVPDAVPTLWIGWSIPSALAPEVDAAAVVTSMVRTTFWNHVHEYADDIGYVDAEVLPGERASLFFLKATLKTGRDPQASADSLIQTFRRGLGEQTFTGDVTVMHKRYESNT